MRRMGILERMGEEVGLKDCGIGGSKYRDSSLRSE
jgi:hypothetical protein